MPACLCVRARTCVIYIDGERFLLFVAVGESYGVLSSFSFLTDCVLGLCVNVLVHFNSFTAWDLIADNI